MSDSDDSDNESKKSSPPAPKAKPTSNGSSKPNGSAAAGKV